MKRLTLLLFFVLSIGISMSSLSQMSMDYNILIEDLEFTPGVTIDINVNVYVNENATNWADHGKIFAIEGMAHTANCWKPLAEEFFARGCQELEINEFYAIDMPGRGLSGLPVGVDYLLEDMYMDEYLSVIEGAIRYLNEELEIFPSTIMGHSMGGLEVILLQNRLIDHGSNLRKAFKIKNAILLAPAIPAPLEWNFLTNGGATGIADYAQWYPETGIVLDLPFYVWPYLFFTNTCCYAIPNMVPGAPDPMTVLNNGYNSIEAGPILYQMSGLPTPPPYPYKPRVSADQGIFMPKNGVELTIIADEFDKMMRPDEELVLYKYLTNDKHGNGMHTVTGDHTCHDTHISDPHAIVELLNKPYFFKSLEGDLEEGNISESTLSTWPNPVISTANLKYEIYSTQYTTLAIYDAYGRVIETLVEEEQGPGEYNLSFNTDKLADGVYILKLTSGNQIVTGKLIKR